MGRRNKRDTSQQSKRRRYVPPKYIKTAQAETSGTCLSGKLRYGDERNAALALKSAQRKHLASHAPTIERRYYICQPAAGQPAKPSHCFGYHLTHLDKIGD